MTDTNIEKKKNEDDVVDEIHKSREMLLAKFDGDLRALFDDARKRDKSSGRNIVNREHLEHSSANHQ